MGWFWATVGAILVVVIAVAVLMDHRGRKQGHRLRSGRDMWLDVRETVRDVHVAGGNPIAAGGNVAWTAYARKNSRGGKSEAGD